MKINPIPKPLILARGLILSGGAIANSDLDQIESAIKAPAGDESAGSIKQQTEQLMLKARQDLDSSDVLHSSTAIYLNHNRSLLNEAFHHLEQIAPYADYRDSTYLDKLQ